MFHFHTLCDERRCVWRPEEIYLFLKFGARKELPKDSRGEDEHIFGRTLILFRAQTLSCNSSSFVPQLLMQVLRSVVFEAAVESLIQFILDMSVVWCGLFFAFVERCSGLGCLFDLLWCWQENFVCVWPFSPVLEWICLPAASPMVQA